MLVFVCHFSSLGVGGYAVYVFFILSGYWLDRMWSERYKPTRSPYFTYMVSRFWRLGPVMALVSLITLALLPVIGVPLEKIFSANPAHMVFSSTFLLGYAWLPYLPVGSAWSLDVEMQFYIVAPLIAGLLAMRRGRWAALTAALACSLAIGLIDPHMLPVLPKYIAFFVVGMMSSATKWRPSARLAQYSGGFVLLAAMLILLSPWRGLLIGGATPGPLYEYNAALSIALALATLPYAIHTTSRPSDATDRMMADLSYIIYLLHWPAMQWFFTISGPFSARLAVAATSFAIVPPAAWLIWKFYDKPINRARARWVTERAEQRPAEPVLAEPAGP